MPINDAIESNFDAQIVRGRSAYLPHSSHCSSMVEQLGASRDANGNAVMSKPSQRKRVLLAWEQGRNLGHLSRLSFVAKSVQQAGADPVWVVPPHYLNDPQISNLHHQRISVPSPRYNNPDPGARTDSFADVLLSQGFGDFQHLLTGVEAWLRLLSEVDPSSVVLDYAPTAQLAALILGLPAFQITNGFDSPPPHCPIFGITVRGPYLEKLNAKKVAQLSGVIAQVSMRLTGKSYSLDSLINYPRRVFDGVAEMDPYASFRTHDFHVGPLEALPLLDTVQWPSRTDSSGQFSARIFAYVRDRASGDAWLKALSEIDCVAIVVAPYLSLQETKEPAHPNITVVNQPVNLLQVLPQADAVMSYGSVTLACRSLLLGKPQLVMPVDMEKCLFANRLAAEGVANLWRPGNQPLAAAIKNLMGSESVGQSARRIATCYSPAFFKNQQSEFMNALTQPVHQQHILRWY